MIKTYKQHCHNIIPKPLIEVVGVNQIPGLLPVPIVVNNGAGLPLQLSGTEGALFSRLQSYPPTTSLEVYFVLWSLG